MEPEKQNPARAADNAGEPADDKAQIPRDLSWVLVGEQGLRAGWSALIFVGLYYALLPVLDTVAVSVYPELAQGVFSPLPVLIAEFLPFLAILTAGLFMARAERRSPGEYNLRDSRPLRHFAGGATAGFVALSVLVAAMSAGGWIHFGHVALSSAQGVKFGLVWAGAFLLVGLCEEGVFRCFLQATLTRGINFWWALATVSTLCLLVQLKSAPQGAGGVYLAALLGLVPCWLLQRSGAADAGFWQAAWVTSTAFGYYHTGNNGETWLGIFAAALIGFVFCVSVHVTGSAWWAIGCHTAWDWTETFVYGTADSGYAAQGHLLTTTASGNSLWSGGSDGPEGSLLVVPAILLLLAVLVFLYGRKRPATLGMRSTEGLAG
jgi:hypothetical protein